MFEVMRINLSLSLRALIEQLSEVLCNNNLNQVELSTLLLLLSRFRDYCNNLSERDLRAAKRFSLNMWISKKKRSLKEYCVGLSIVQTFHRQSIPVIGGIQWLFDNDGNVFDNSVMETICAKTDYFQKQ